MNDEMSVSVDSKGIRKFVVKLDEEACRDWEDPGTQSVIEFGIAMGAEERDCTSYEIWQGLQCVARGVFREDIGWFPASEEPDA